MGKDCRSCGVIGCKNRTEYYVRWGTAMKNLNQKKTREGPSKHYLLKSPNANTIGCGCIACQEEYDRLKKIKECCGSTKNETESVGVAKAVGRYDGDPYFKETGNLAFDADIVFFYSCTPNFKKRVKTVLYGKSRTAVEELVIKSYPNIIRMNVVEQER